MSIDELVTSVSSYIKKKHGSTEGIDRWRDGMRIGMNHKIIGFLFLHGRPTTREKFISLFKESDLLGLYDDLKERSPKPTKMKTQELDPVIKQNLLQTLYRYSVALRLVKIDDRR